MRRGDFVAGLAAAATAAAAIRTPDGSREGAICATAGALYLRAFPAEADVRLLRRLLYAGRRVSTTAAQRRAVAARAARDFAATDVVALDGWVFARSEARFCALAYLETHRAD